MTCVRDTSGGVELISAKPRKTRHGHWYAVRRLRNGYAVYTFDSPTAHGQLAGTVVNEGERSYGFKVLGELFRTGVPFVGNRATLTEAAEQIVLSVMTDPNHPEEPCST